jgi:predicted short-subunit dehydrogenase-like oxidoreductase (DUF2520 family)
VQVVIVGAGRLGRSLQALLARTGTEVPTVGRGAVLPPADVVLLCVPDREVRSAAAAIPPGPVLLHTAGALDLDVLEPHPERGSLHPLMTFPGPEVSLPDPTTVPAAVAGTPRALAAARALCTQLGFVAFEVPGDRRLYHAAAVVAGNLATFLATEGAVLLRAAGVAEPEARRVLLPLAQQSLGNSIHGLRAALTGPIARGDTATLAAHAVAMREANLHEMAASYELLTRRAAAAFAGSDET